MHRTLLSLLSFLTVYGPVAALADQPYPKQIGLQEPVTEVMRQMTVFHNQILMPVITFIVIFVLGLLLYIAIRFNAKANPVPSNTTHNVPLEILWTLAPVVILIMIAVPSFRLLYLGAIHPEPELTVKVTGFQWYWGYEYPDNGDVSYLSNMVPDKDIDPAKNQVRLLSADEPMVVPVDTNIVFQVTAQDVLHAFAVPAFGVKVDAVPGRLNQTWARIEKPGVYYGQCSELCGPKHAFMPIEVHAVSKEDFAKWIVSKGGTMKTAAVQEADTPAPEASPATAPAEVEPEAKKTSKE